MPTRPRVSPPPALRPGAGCRSRGTLAPGFLVGGLLAGLLAGCDGNGGTGPEPDPVVECTPSNTVSLAVGEALLRSGSQARTLCISGAEGAEYVLVPMVLDSQAGTTRPLTFVAEGTAGGITAPSPGPPPPGTAPAWGDASASGTAPAWGGASASGTAPSAGTAVLGGGEGAGAEGLLRDHAFDHALREREIRELAPLLRGGGTREAASGVTAPALSPPRTRPQVGDFITLNARADSACGTPLNRTAEVVAISEGAIVVADVDRPPEGFSQAQFEHFAVAYDTLIAPVVERHFGAPTDLDGRGGVILFFTPEVNRLTDPGSDRYVGGFFYSRDLFFRTATPRLQACPSSNEAEILYLMVPDPQGTVNGNRRTVDFVNRIALATIAHELQHLVNAGRRLHTLQLANPFEAVWLNEGMSHMAEEILFFEATGAPRKANLGLPELQQGGSSWVGAVKAYHVANLQRFIRFLEAPETHAVYDSVDTLEGRGAAQQFLRYAADRLPQDDVAFFRALTDSPQTGWTNLAQRVGGEEVLRRWLADWAVAIYADDRVPGLATEHRLRSWSHPSIFQWLQGNNFPVRTRALSPQAPVDLTLRAGGAAYLRFSVPGPGTARIVTSSGSGPLPATLRMTLLRTR